jgi:hypothetical protein
MPEQSERWNWGLPVTSRAFGPYVTALGQLTLAWNELHETLALVFCMVMGGGLVNQYLAIWHAIKVDRAQRDILLAAAKAGNVQGSSYPNLVSDLEWICGKANAVEDARNDALHALMGISAWPRHHVGDAHDWSWSCTRTKITGKGSPHRISLVPGCRAGSNRLRAGA